MCKETKQKQMIFEYGHTVILRRSGVSKKDWEYLCHKFGIINYAPEEVTSITIDGEDDYGRLMISITVEV